MKVMFQHNFYLTKYDIFSYTCHIYVSDSDLKMVVTKLPASTESYDHQPAPPAEL